MRTFENRRDGSLMLGRWRPLWCRWPPLQRSRDVSRYPALLNPPTLTPLASGNILRVLRAAAG
jgi:hypothetical protein